MLPNSVTNPVTIMGTKEMALSNHLFDWLNGFNAAQEGGLKNTSNDCPACLEGVSMDKLKLTGPNLGRVFNIQCGHVRQCRKIAHIIKTA